MGQPYCITNLDEALNGGFEATIAGPGTSAGGVRYWFETEQEVHAFVENLNLSYREAKGLASWRKSRHRRSATTTVSTPAAIAAR